MFNVDKYNAIQNKIYGYKNQIEILEDKKKKLEGLILKSQDNCNHDLVLSYANDKGIKKSKCLFCDCYIELENNIDIFTEREIDNKNILDVTVLVSEYSQKLTKRNENVLVLKAKEKLNEIINFARNNHRVFDKHLIKNVILNAVVVYDNELKQEKTKKLVKDKK